MNLPETDRLTNSSLKITQTHHAHAKKEKLYL